MSAFADGFAKFQSTLPMRGATDACCWVVDMLIFQSTLPMRGATKCKVPADWAKLISIHAPHAGSDAGLPEVEA